jgi:hypothetical protein
VNSVAFQKLRRLRSVLAQSDDAKLKEFLDRKGLKMLSSTLRQCAPASPPSSSASATSGGKDNVAPKPRTGMQLAMEYECLKCMRAVASSKVHLPQC